MPTQEEIVQALGNFTVMQLCELTRALEDKWGVKAAPAPIEEFRAAPAYGAPPVDLQTEFSVLISHAGDKKLEVIKSLRPILSLGLAEAKAWVESISGPKLVKEGVSRVEAEEIQRTLQGAGAVVEIK
jgi:large subunit ribosomal protein L7/L12